MSITRARRRRWHMSDAERHLWWGLRRSGLGGWTFRRQVPVGPFIVDFLCVAGRLAVEVEDAPQVRRRYKHAARSRLLLRRGYQVLRFWNSEVLDNRAAVLATIRAALEEGRRGP